MRWVRRLLGFGVFVGLLVLGWRFAARNSGDVSVDYLAGQFGGPVWLVLLVVFTLGVVVAGAVGMVQATRLGLLARRYRRAVHGLEAEVHQLRNLPLAPDAAADAALGGALDTGPAADREGGASGSLRGVLERGA